MNRIATRPNRTIDRSTACDLVIDAGRYLGPGTRIDLVPSGAGFDAQLPAEELANLARVIRMQEIALGYIEIELAARDAAIARLAEPSAN